jgi:hypothetical protein
MFVGSSIPGNRLKKGDPVVSNWSWFPLGERPLSGSWIGVVASKESVAVDLGVSVGDAV